MCKPKIGTLTLHGIPQFLNFLDQLTKASTHIELTQ